MAMLQVPDLRKFLRRRKVRADDQIAVTQADGLKRVAGVSIDDGEAEAPALSITTIEPKITSSGAKSRSVAELQRSYDQVMTLVGRIGDHLDVQAERQARLDQVVDRLPAAIDVLPQLSRQNEQLIEMLGTFLARTDAREQTMNEALDRLGGSARQQSEMLGLLHQQLQTNSDTSRLMADTLGEFRSTLTDLGDSNSRAVNVLADMAAAADRRESKMEMILGRTQKWMIAALVCCGAAAITALVIALY